MCQLLQKLSNFNTEQCTDRRALLSAILPVFLPAAVKSMIQNGPFVWCGCDGGFIGIYRVDDGAFLKSIKAHTDTVDTLAAVGNQVGVIPGLKVLCAMHSSFSHAGVG